MGSRRCKKKLWKIIKKWAIKKLRTASSNINNKKNKKTITKFEQKKDSERMCRKLKDMEMKRNNDNSSSMRLTPTILFWLIMMIIGNGVAIVVGPLKLLPNIPLSTIRTTRTTRIGQWVIVTVIIVVLVIIFCEHIERCIERILSFFLVVQQGNNIDPMKDIIKEE